MAISPILNEPIYLGDWLKGEVEIPQQFSRDNVTLEANWTAGGTAVLSGSGVASITLGSVGRGYAPNSTLPVTLAGGGGSGAIFTATVDSSGAVSGFTQIAAGTGYTSAPTVTVPNPPATTLVTGTVLGKITSTGQYVQLNPNASDGSQNVAGILIADQSISTSPVVAGAITRSAEFASTMISFPSGITTNQQATAIAQLAALGIIARSTS